MGIVFACIAPHGAETIPELAGDKLEAFAETRKSMKRLASLMKKQQPETIIIATPHNLRLEATIGIITTQFAEGSFEANSKQVKLRLECDRQLANKILKSAKKAKLPVIGANYGTNEGPSSCMPMDWGTLIPLWFLTNRGTDKTKIIIVTPSREITFQKLIKFGYATAETVDILGKKVAFVASADQGHAHKADGPYGFSPASAKFDKTVALAVKKNNLEPLFRLKPKFIEDAKPDSLWQMAMLQGILEYAPMKSLLLSYQAPTYFGMLCAAYTPIKTERL